MSDLEDNIVKQQQPLNENNSKEVDSIQTEALNEDVQTSLNVQEKDEVLLPQVEDNAQTDDRAGIEEHFVNQDLVENSSIVDQQQQEIQEVPIEQFQQGQQAEQVVETNLETFTAEMLADNEPEESFREEVETSNTEVIADNEQAEAFHEQVDNTEMMMAGNEPTESFHEELETSNVEMTTVNEPNEPFHEELETSNVEMMVEDQAEEPFHEEVAIDENQNNALEQPTELDQVEEDPSHIETIPDIQKEEDLSLIGSFVPTNMTPQKMEDHEVEDFANVSKIEIPPDVDEDTLEMNIAEIETGNEENRVLYDGGEQTIVTHPPESILQNLTEYNDVDRGEEDEDYESRASRLGRRFSSLNHVSSQSMIMTRSDLLSAREDSIRQLPTPCDAEFLEKEMEKACEEDDGNVIQFLLTCGASSNMLAKVLKRLIYIKRERKEDTNLLAGLLRHVRLGVSTRSRGPGRIFSFGGENSGIEISGTSTFAKSFASAWGFSAWIWVAQTCSPFTLASFLTKERYGISITIVPSATTSKDPTIVLFESADEKKRNNAKIALSNEQFKCKTWHHLFVQHTRRRSGSSVLVRIDDKTIQEITLSFPGLGLASPITKARLMENFEGFTGPIWILDDVFKGNALLAKQQVSPLLAEGEEIGSGFNIFPVVRSSTNPETSSSSSSASSAPSASVFGSYQPERVIGNSCLDLHGGHLGTLMSKSYSWCVLSARDALRSVGGTTVALLPFLNETVNSEIALQTILLISSFLEGHSPNQNEFFEAGGPSLLYCALQKLDKDVLRDMCMEPNRDLVSALSALTRAVGIEVVGTSNEGARLMRSVRGIEFELDRLLTFNLDFWVRFGISFEGLVRVVQLCVKKISERPAAYRKKFGLRFFLDVIRRMYEAYLDEGNEILDLKSCQTAGAIFVDGVILPMFTMDAPVTKDEVRMILDVCIGSGNGLFKPSQADENAFRERRRGASWDQPTVESSHDALRLLVRLHQFPFNHSGLCSFNIPSILAVEVVAFGGLGERVRALALRAIGLNLSCHPSKDVSEHFASIGGYSYLSTALSYAVAKGEQRFAAKPSFTSPKLNAGSRKSLNSSFGSSKPGSFFSTPPKMLSPQKRFLSADLAASDLSSNSSKIPAHISDATYNALLSMVITTSGLGGSCSSSTQWKRASQMALTDEEDSDPALPATVLDDVLKISNIHALSVVLDQLCHMSALVQQRTFQDFFVLLKFEPENRKGFATIPNWQMTLASFLSAHLGKDEKSVGIFEMGVKIWVLVLQDVMLRDPDVLSETYWLGESFGQEISQAVLSKLLDSLRSISASPSQAVLESLVKTAELSPTHYDALFYLLEHWKFPELGSSMTNILFREFSRIILQEEDLAKCALAARRSFMILNSTHSDSLSDGIILLVSRVHSSLERLQGKIEFLPEEKDFLDSCAVLLVECSKRLSVGFKDSRSVSELIEVAAILAPHKAKPMPREAWLHSRWALNVLEPGFSSLAQATLDDLSFTIKRNDREKYDGKFAKDQERIAMWAKARGDLEANVRESEDRHVYTELARLQTNALAFANEKLETRVKWEKLLKEVTKAETVWKNDQVRLGWIISEREDYLRRHSVLEINLNEVDHEDASYENTLKATMTPQKTLKRNEDNEENNNNRVAITSFDSKEEINYVAEGAKFVTPSIVTHGRVEVSSTHVMFYSVEDELQRKRWRLDELIELHSRRYLLRPTAIELFFSDRTTVFFAFTSATTREEFSQQILKLKPRRMEKAFTGSLAPPAQVFKRSKLTEMWRKREISNFEYLMRLNTIAGRTYNDVTQFFVFPWIIMDYESTELNLSDPKTFRDLSKPVGALNPDRMREVSERYQAFTEADMGMPPFHHGSHYSSAGVVLHYLIRIEPYTTLAIELQGGRFDVSDRLFHSIKDCFRSCYSSLVDCRELIPEFYYLSEMFLNQDKLDLGKRQDGHVVDNVVLPVWAKNDPELFVRLNREAMESEYVSSNIHSWIDLIFGYKQTGKDAIEACNVFNYLSYEGAVDLDAMADPAQRAAVELQILEFGQCPSQLLTHPHPKRISLNEWGRNVSMGLIREASYFRHSIRKMNILLWRKSFWIKEENQNDGMSPIKPLSKLFSVVSGPIKAANVVTPPAVISLRAFDDRFVAVHADFTVTVLHVIPSSSDPSSLDLRQVSQAILPSSQISRYLTARSRDVGLVGTALGISLRGKATDFTCTQGGNLSISSAYFDGSVRCFKVDGTKLEVNVIGHRGWVTSLAQEGRWLVSGSLDGTACLWKVGGLHDSRDEIFELFGETATKGGGPLLSIDRYLFGNHSAVTSVALSDRMGIVATGGNDGSIVIHGLYDSAKSRMLPKIVSSPIDMITLAHGSVGIIAHSRMCYTLLSFSVNGRLLSQIKEEEALNFCEVCTFHEQEVIVTGGERTGELCIRRVFDLHPIRRISYAKRYRGVRCASVSPDGKFIYVGCIDGSVIVLGDASNINHDTLVSNSQQGGKKATLIGE